MNKEDEHGNLGMGQSMFQRDQEHEHGNLGMGQSMFQRDQEHELGHDAEEEAHQQELQLQSQSQPTGEQRQVETGVPSKRSLNMSKCERCRLDKKKVCCLPIPFTIYTSVAFGDNKHVRLLLCLT